MVAATGIRDIDQSISDPQLQSIVGVILQHEDVDDIEEGLAERQEEEDRCGDVIEILGDDVGGPTVDKFDNRADPSLGKSGGGATKRGVVLEQPEGSVGSG